MVEVLCIGHASYDLSVFLPAFPAENSKGETDQLLQSGGGPAANAAYLLSAWGIRCSFAGLLGDDAYGRQITAEFKAVGTNLSLVNIPPLYETPVSLILVNLKNGSRTLVNRKGHQASLRISKPALTKMAPRFLLFDGHEPNAALSALESFPDTVSVLDAGSLRHGTSILASKVDYLVASEKFASQDCKLTGLKTSQDLRSCIKSLRERYGNKVVITLGERGVIADDGGGYCRMGALKAKPVDTTGAGDIFHGAFVYGLIKGMSFREVLHFASVAAGLSVLRRGGRLSVPSLRQVQRAAALSYAN